MSALLALLIWFIPICLFWRLLASLFQSYRPVEPADAEPVDDPFASVPAFRKNSPKEDLVRSPWKNRGKMIPSTAFHRGRSKPRMLVFLVRVRFSLNVRSFR